MPKRALDSYINLLAIPLLLFDFSGLKAYENCANDTSRDNSFTCGSRLVPKTAAEIIATIDNNFRELPSCQVVNSRLDGFVSSVQKMANAVTKTNINEPSILDQINLARESSSSAEEDRIISSKEVFSRRFSISPVARQFYFTYLQSQEVARGSFDRPVLNFQFDLNANPGFEESLSGAISPIPNSAYSYSNETNPYVSLYYPFSFQNLFASKASSQDQKSAYYTFLNQAVTDSLQTVADFYDFKSNLLSTILNSFQFQASADRVFRLTKLEKKGLSSRLDISRASVTKTAQSTNLVKSKSDLAQSYDKLMGDFLFPKDFDATIFPKLSSGLSTACWAKPPSESITAALKTNPSLLALRRQIESSKLTRKSILAQNLPDISLSVSYETDNQWGDINGTGNTNDYYRSSDVVASASFNWNIFDFGQTLANAKSQSYATNSLRNQLTQSLNQLETDLLTNFSSYISSTQNVISLAKASEEATMNYINALKASQVGILNETDVDNIFNQLTSINSSLVTNIKSRNNSAVAIATLVQSEGFDSLDFNYFLEEWKKSFTQ
jgi:outer membrane protein TolC